MYTSIFPEEYVYLLNYGYGVVAWRKTRCWCSGIESQFLQKLIRSLLSAYKPLIIFKFDVIWTRTRGYPSFLVFWGLNLGSLSAVSDGNYHDGNSMSGLLTSFVSINKLYLLTARCYIHDYFDLL